MQTHASWRTIFAGSSQKRILVSLLMSILLLSLVSASKPAHTAFASTTNPSNSAVSYAEQTWNWDYYDPNPNNHGTVSAGTSQPNFVCAEFVARALSTEGLMPGLNTTSPQQVGQSFASYTRDGTTWNLWNVGANSIVPNTGLYNYLVHYGGIDIGNNYAQAAPGDALFFGDPGQYTVSHVVILTATGTASNGSDSFTDSHNVAEQHVAVNWWNAFSSGVHIVHMSVNASAKIVENSTNTFVAIGSTLFKYDHRGGTGADMFATNSNGTGGAYYIGNQQFSSAITALAANDHYLFIALASNRVVKTNLCGSGNVMCAANADGGGSWSGYSYWIGDQDYSAPVTGLAANSSYLFTNLAGGGVMRTVKTNLCGSGGNMCALSSDGVGTSGLSGYSYWIGRQDWSWSPTAIAANDSIVLTTIGSTRVCKTGLGTTSGNVFALSDGSCVGNYPGYSNWIGYQDWSQTVTNLAVDGSRIWFGLGGTSRLVQTTLCGGGGNMCALSSDGIGTNGLSGYSYWVGRQDWCSGYNQMSVTSDGTYIDSLFSTGSGIRVVQALGDTGANMFATSDCTGTGKDPRYNAWIGYQNFS